MICTVLPSRKSQSEFLATPKRDWSRVPANVLAAFDEKAARDLDTSKKPVGLPTDADLTAAFEANGFHVFRAGIRFDELV
jgi:uncharacterized protein YcgL (UPF0745 family)